MFELSAIGYPAFDKPEVCQALFYPRREWGLSTDGGFEKSLFLHIIPLLNVMGIHDPELSEKRYGMRPCVEDEEREVLYVFY